MAYNPQAFTYGVQAARQLFAPVFGAYQQAANQNWRRFQQDYANRALAAQQAANEQRIKENRWAAMFQAVSKLYMPQPAIDPNTGQVTWASVPDAQRQEAIRVLSAADPEMFRAVMATFQKQAPAAHPTRTVTPRPQSSVTVPATPAPAQSTRPWWDWYGRYYGAVRRWRSGLGLPSSVPVKPTLNPLNTKYNWGSSLLIGP